MRELVGDDGRRVADFMLAVLEDERERTEVRMEAARWLADRGFGRAHVPVEARQPGGLEAQERELEAARPALPPGDE